MQTENDPPAKPDKPKYMQVSRAQVSIENYKIFKSVNIDKQPIEFNNNVKYLLTSDSVSFEIRISDDNEMKTNPLFQLAQHGKTDEHLILLIDIINIKGMHDSIKQKALELAISASNEPMTKLLLGKKIIPSNLFIYDNLPKLNITDPCYGQLVTLLNTNNDANFLNEQMSKSGDKKLSSRYLNPLFELASNKQADKKYIIYMLLFINNKEIKDLYKQNALFIAMQSLNYEMVLTLLNKGIAPTKEFNQLFNEVSQSVKNKTLDKEQQRLLQEIFAQLNNIKGFVWSRPIFMKVEKTNIRDIPDIPDIPDITHCSNNPVFHHENLASLKKPS